MKLFLGIFLFVAMNSAYANCWGVGERTTDILRQQLRLESNNGPVVAVVSYRVNVRHEVCESGGFVAGAIDMRKCASQSRGRQFIRLITVTPKDGRSITLAQTEKLVDGGVAIEENGPCTDHATALTERGFASRIGTANSWASEINQDKAEVERALSLIGKITDSKIVFSL